jgi:MarR family transcriptional regulator, organic hydroperoxide resistance regulator
MTRDDEALAHGLSNRLFFRLYQCANLLHKTGTRALEAHGITTQQWAIMGALARPDAAGGVSVGDMASYLMVSRQNLTGVLSRLEAQGCLERVVDPKDNRSRRIRLTAAGQRLWNDLQPGIEAFYGAALERMSNADRIHMIHYLDLLRESFRKLDDGVGHNGD